MRKNLFGLFALSVLLNACSAGDATQVADSRTDELKLTPFVPQPPQAPEVEWAGPTQLAANNGFATVDVAINASGNGMAIWTKAYGADAGVYAKAFLSGQWTSVKQLSAANQPESAQVAIDATGRALAVWRQQLNGQPPNVLMASTYDPAASQWATPTRIQHPAVLGHVVTPRVAMAPSGEALVAVRQNTYPYDPNKPIDESIWAVRYSPVTGWDTPGLLVNDATDADVAMDDDGNGMVVWQSGRTFSGGPIAASYFSASTHTFSSPVLLEPAQGHSQKPSVAMSAQGAIATWSHGPNNQNFDIHVNRFVGGQWLGAQALETANSYSVRSDVAMSNNGKAVVVWQRWSYPGGIFSSQLNGSTWSTPLRISSNDPAIYVNQYGVSVEMTRDGKALAAWHEVQPTLPQSGALRVIARRLHSGIWGARHSLDAPFNGWDYEAQNINLAISENQSALAIWIRGEWSYYDVWSNYLPPPPPPPTGEPCGGILGTACAAGSECLDVPDDGCDPWDGGSDCPGYCKAQACGGIAGLTCPKGSSCVDDPSDKCLPGKAVDCPGICQGNVALDRVSRSGLLRDATL